MSSSRFNLKFFKRSAKSQSSTTGHNTSGASIPSSPSIESHSASDQDNMANANADTDTSYSHLAGSQYARKRRELLELARSLNDLDVDNLLDIPKIVVIGSQSSGKSSLVEAVTGINVPRDDGMCTRSPMECTILTTTAQWSCSISLRDDEGHTRPFSPELTTKDEVEIWIRRAQATLLCPHISDDVFKSKSYVELKSATDPSQDPNVSIFTTHKVVIDIKDPSGADLAFVDLPGLVQNETDEVVQLVKDLVVKYISSPSTIILVAIPATDDMENQQAMKLAKEADEDGQRTIGVVTKPDMLGLGQSGARRKWADIFEGKTEKHRLRLGYYCVRLPSDEERNRSLASEDMTRISSRFFSTTTPWKDLNVHNHLGVENLVRDISALLMQVLLKALPDLREKVQKLLAECREQIDQLPALPSTDPALEVVQRVGRYCDNLRAVVYGRSEDKSFIHQSRDFYKLFMRAIRQSAPDFRPFQKWGRYQKPEEPPSHRRELEFCATHPISYCASTSSAGDDDQSESFNDTDRAEVGSRVMDLEDVRAVIKDSTGWELPHNIPYEAKTRLIKQFIALWIVPSDKCFKDIQSLLETIVRKMVLECFGQFPILQVRVEELLQTQMEAAITESKTALHAVLARENDPYWTQNLWYFETSRNLWLEHYKRIWKNREDYRAGRSMAPRSGSQAYEVDSSLEYQERVALTALGALGYRDINRWDFVRLLHPDDYDEEIIVMADVRSYFHVAFKRVIDNVPMTIQRDLVEGFANALQAYLLEKLEIGSPERLHRLLAESEEIALKRIQLQERLRKLEDMKSQLNTFRL